MTDHPASTPQLGPEGDRGLVALATRRPVGVTMVALSVVLFGAISFQLLPRNLMPDISYPSITVRTEYPGAAPIDVETRVSRRLEEMLSQVRDLRRVSSISRAETSDVILEFAWGTQMSLATTEVREKVSQVVFPDEVGRPTFLRYDPTLDPILQIGLYRAGAGRQSEEDLLIDLRIFAEDELEQALESLSGVAGARVRGGLEKEVRIDVDERQLRAKGVTVDLVARRIRDENLNQSSGMLYEGEQSRAVRTVNEFRDLDEIRKVILRREASVPIRLSDVATVAFGYKDPEVITRINGKPCVKIDIYKEADANVVDVARLVREKLFGTEEERARLEMIRELDERRLAAAEKARETPEKKRKPGASGGSAFLQRPSFLQLRVAAAGLDLEVMSDQSVFIQQALDDVRRNVLFGGVLAILVLLIFLRSARFTLAVGLSIPLSVMAAFVAMHVFGVSLNMMSLGGLALGIGMLVDNSVVVLESIFRCREEGDEPRPAAVRGTGVVAGAVTASTLTTVAVFFPIVFVEGVAGQVFRDQALTVVISLLASLAVALYFIPAMVGRRVRDLPAAAPESSEAASRGALPRLLARRRLREVVDDFRARLLRLRWAAWKAPFLILWVASFLLPVFVVSLLVEILTGWSLWLALRGVGAFGGIWRLTAPVVEWSGRGAFGLTDRLFAATHEAYLALLRLALRWRVGVVIVTLAVAFVSFRMRLQTELIPEVHQGEFTVKVQLPRATRIEETDRVMRPWEAKLLSAERFPEIASVTTTIGVDKDELAEADEGEHTAKFLVRLAPSGSLRRREEAVKTRVRELLRDARFESLEIENPVLFSFKTPIEVEVSGHELAELRRIATQVKERMDEIEELEDVRTSLARGNPEIQVVLDRELLSRYDLGVGQIGGVVRGKVQGNVSSYFTLGDRRVPIRVRLKETDRDSLEELANLVVHSGDGVDLRLRDLVAGVAGDRSPEGTGSLPIGEGHAEIRRIAHQRAVVITANLAGMSLGAATAGIREALATIDYPPEFQVDFGGQKEEMDRALDSLARALFLAVFLVYVIMAMQFESLIQPFIIIVSIPLAFVGVVPVLVFLEEPLSIVVFIGMIVLAGIVVNNTIVLVDTANQLRRGGLSIDEALIRAGELRLRPILMTTATTVLGLLPLTGVFGGFELLEPLLGSGQGEEIRAPLAITIITGLITSTLLTLVVIPVIASLVLSFTARFRGGLAGSAASGAGGVDG